MSHLQQQQVEDMYSKKNIRQYIKNDVDVNSIVFRACLGAVEKYKQGNYYKSKNKRIVELQESELTTQEIILELFIAVLPIQEISPIQAVAAQLSSRIGFKDLLNGVKTAAEIIAVCASSGLYSIYRESDKVNNIGTLGIMAHYQLDKETQDLIDNTMYLPPMLCTPNDWIDNRDGGYLSGSGSVILGAFNHHNEKLALDVINTIQSIPWELNEEMLKFEETSNKELDTFNKRKQFNVLKDMSRQVYTELVKADNLFYFVWKYCKRGRMHSQGYHVDLQSTEYKKAVLQFANKKLLT